MRLATVLRGVGQTFITAGVVILLFVVYELYVTGLETARAQNQLIESIENEWQRPAPTVRPTAPAFGSGVAILRIPRFGRDWRKVVVEGVSVPDLRRGPGHYPGTRLPGQVGNFVVSGHRTTYGAPFHRIDELRPGDAVVVETRDTWYVYAVRRTEIVPPTQIEVTYDVPGDPRARPTEALITLTSCHPKYSARQRIIVFGALSATRAKSDGAPPELAG